MPATITDQERIQTAVHTAVSELPQGTHPDDIADCVYGQVGHQIFTDNEEEILNLIERMS